MGQAMDTKRFKLAKNLMVGDIFVWPEGPKRQHFKVTSVKDHGSLRKYVKAVFIWSSGDGKYIGHDPGIVEGFTLRNNYNLEVVRTTKNGCCPDCDGVLSWVSLALKCDKCGKIVL